MQYLAKEPFKLLRSAALQNAKINKELDQQIHTYPQIRQLASTQEEAVRVGVQKSKQRNEMFRKLEQEDRKRRFDIMSELQKKTNTNKINKNKELQKRQKSAKDNNHKVQKVFHKHIEQEKNKQINQQEEAIKVRKQREKQIKQKQQSKVVKKKPKINYNQAIQKIQKRDSIIQQFAQQTSERIEDNFRRNYKKINPQHEEAKIQKFKRYMQIRAQQKMLIGLKTEKYLQNHCSSLQECNQMSNRKINIMSKLAEKIQNLNKSKSERAQKNKMYLNEQTSMVSEKCLNRMNQSFNAYSIDKSLRNSSFMITSKTWRSQGKSRRDEIRSIRQIRNQDILNRHISATYRNKGEARINNKFTDLKMKASFNAQQFL